MIRFVGFIVATVAFFTISSIAHAQYDVPALGTGTKTVEIVIENATKGQVFSPGVLASHRSGVKLWAEGEPASLGLRLLAEDGNIDPFMYETMKGIGKDFRFDHGDLPDRSGSKAESRSQSERRVSARFGGDHAWNDQ